MVMSLLDQQVRRMQAASFVVSDETEVTDPVTGAQRTRIPDEIDRDARLVREVKNVQKLDATQQIRDMAQWARDNGYKFVIVVDKGRTDYTGFIETMKQKYGLDVEIDASRNLS